MHQATEDWSADDHELSSRQGWVLSEMYQGTDHYQLQRLDDSDLLQSDAEAWLLVKEEARKGSTLHCKALRVLKATSPGEFAKIQAFRSEDRATAQRGPVTSNVVPFRR